MTSTTKTGMTKFNEIKSLLYSWQLNIEYDFLPRWQHASHYKVNLTPGKYLMPKENRT